MRGGIFFALICSDRRLQDGVLLRLLIVQTDANSHVRALLLRRGSEKVPLARTELSTQLKIYRLFQDSKEMKKPVMEENSQSSRVLGFSDFFNSIDSLLSETGI